jgi:hypothetical protein
VSHDGPTDESRSNTKFSITFVGEGWSEKKGDGVQHDSTPDTRVITKVNLYLKFHGGTRHHLKFAIRAIILFVSS